MPGEEAKNRVKKVIGKVHLRMPLKDGVITKEQFKEILKMAANEAGLGNPPLDDDFDDKVCSRLDTMVQGVTTDAKNMRSMDEKFVEFLKENGITKEDELFNLYDVNLSYLVQILKRCSDTLSIRSALDSSRWLPYPFTVIQGLKGELRRVNIVSTCGVSRRS